MLTVVEPDPTVEVLVVAGEASVPRSDRPLVERWEAMGFVVTVIDDDDLVAVEVANRFDLVWISSTVKPKKVDDHFTSVVVPLGVAEPFVFRANSMATGEGQVSGVNRVAGADGSIDVVTTGRATVSWGVPAASAIVVATLPGATYKATVFTYGTGDVLTDGSPAPSCRAGFFAGHDSPPLFTDAGWDYFDTTTTQLLACAPGPGA